MEQAQATKLCFVTLLSVVVFFINPIQAKKIHYIHWNRANPMFRLDNTDHIVDINSGNLPWEYDQVNIICPVSKADVKMPERHVIYSVSREEFDSCRITNPKPRIVAVCSKPYQLLYFTITFRSFSPTPGGLEFHPGQDYYFISLTRYCTTAKQQVIEFEITISIDDDIWPCRSNILQLVFALASND